MPATEPASYSSPFILDTDMLQDEDLDHFDDQFFSSSIPFDTSAPSPGNHLQDDLSFDAHRSPIIFGTSLPAPRKADINGDSLLQGRQLAPSLQSSASPAGSFRDSSSDSSVYNRKTSSDSSQSPSFSKGPLIADMDLGAWPADELMTGADGAPFFDGTMDPSDLNNGFGFNDKSMENDFDFESAASSPSPFAHKSAHMDSPEMPTMKYETPSHNSPQLKKQFHQAKQSQHSITQSMNGLTTRGSREASPLSAMVTGQESSPANFFNNSPSPNPPMEFVSGPMLGGNPPNPTWPLNFDYNMSTPHVSTGLTPPSLASNVASPLSTGPIFNSTYKPVLTIHPTPMKSRVETQIPIKMTLFPLPPGITKLHLPTYTISKPKLLAKPPPERSPDTLELYTTLVCSSAMQNPEYQRRAFARAANGASSSQESSPKDRGGSDTTSDDDDENKPQNGGDVKICPGCITRERKRAARKKVKKVEEEESWHKDEQKRVIVFNTHEMKDWQQPTSQAPTEATGDRPEPPVPEGAMQVDAPMRIACYCRHQNEKLGFQVIFTIKDYNDRLIAQAITSSIMITDDHKTHNMPNMPLQGPEGVVGQPFGGPSMFGSENGFGLPPAPFRMSHSSSDLQSLQRNFDLSNNMGGFAPPPMPLPGATSSNQSQTTSATMTPRNLSRQGSPSGSSGPTSKKRKASGSGKIPTGLAMTRLETAPNGPGSAPISAPISATAASATSPFLSNHGLSFPLVDTQFVQPPSAAAPIANHFNTGPPTPNSNDQIYFGNNNRSHSMDNLAMHQLYSAPASAHPSRAPSPNGLRNSAFNQQQLQQAHVAQAVANSLYGMPLSLNPHRPPTIHKMIPNEGSKAGGIEVTCLGSGFCQGLEVMFGDVKATTTTFWGETSLVCLLPPSAFAGTVAVTFKHQHQQQQMQQYPAPPIPKQQAYFKYIDDDEQQLIRLALSVLGAKMNGKMEDVRDLARRIVGDGSNTSWGPAPGHSPPGGPVHQQMAGFSAAAFGVDVEGTLLRCLDLVDLDDSPHMPRLNLRRSSGQSMLHLACSLGLHRFVAALLARGANPEPRDKGGYTPMHFAAMHNQPQIVRRLILGGADPTMRTLSGHTPADLATSAEVLASTRRFQHHTRTRSAGSMRSRTSSATSLRSLWEGPTMTPVVSSPVIDDDDTSENDGDDYEDEAADSPAEAFWMKSKSKISSRRPSAQAVSSSELMPKSSLLELPRINSNAVEPASPTVAAMTAFRDQLSAQIAQLQQTMHLNLPQMPNLPNLPNLPDYQAYLHSTPMVRRISAMVPNMGAPRNGASDQTGKENDYKWWDLFSGTVPAAPPAYEDIFPHGDGDTKRSSAEQAAADTLADQKCAELFDQTEIASSSKTEGRPTMLEALRFGSANTITKEQQDQLRASHAEKVKRLRSDRNLFFIWIPLLAVIILAMLYNRVPQALTQVNNLINRFQNRGSVVEVV